MISYANEALFKQDSVAKELSITGSGVNITNSNMEEENFSLEEILNSGRDITFGECNSAKLSFSCGYYDNSIKGKELTVTTTPDGGAAFQFGKYTVVSDEPTADRKWRDVVAYDALYEILKKDVAGWYNTLLPNANSSVTLKQFRDSFFTHVGVTQTSVTLPNDTITITRTVDPQVLTGKSVLNAVCEINGCFGRIGRNGNFEYVFLAIPEKGLFPSETLYPAEDLYPRKYGFEDKEYYENGRYISCKYEDFLTQVIDKLQVWTSSNNVGVTVGTGSNMYIIKDNFLVFDKTEVQLTTIANNIFDKISGVWYRPCNIQAVGNPCLECGDGIRVVTTDNFDIDTIILNRKLKGIQSLRDTIKADGLERRENDANSIHDQIVQVKGNVRKVEADLIEAKQIIAEEIQVERGRIDDLTAIAITTENLSAQTISASQITTGTLDASRITVNNLSASSINAGIMSVSRLADSSGQAVQTAWHDIWIVTGVDFGTTNVIGQDGYVHSVLTASGTGVYRQHMAILKGSVITT